MVNAGLLYNMEDALKDKNIMEKYGMPFTDLMMALLRKESMPFLQKCPHRLRMFPVRD